MTDTVIDVNGTSTDFSTERPGVAPAFDFLRRVAGRADAVGIASQLLEQPGVRNVDEGLLRKMFEELNSEAPPRNLAELKHRVDGLGDTLGDRLTTALAFNGVLRWSDGRLRPGFVEALADEGVDPICACPQPETALVPLDLDRVCEPFYLDKVGVIQNPGFGNTGLDALIQASASFGLARLARARVEDDPVFVPLLDELEEVGYRLLCRRPEIAQPRAAIRAHIDVALERLARGKASRNADQRLDDAVMLAFSELLVASPGRIVQFPPAWKDRLEPIEIPDGDDGFIEGPVLIGQDKAYELAINLNRVRCEVETTPKAGEDEFRIQTKSTVQSKNVLSKNYGHDFDEAEEDIPNLEILKFAVPKKAGSTQTFRTYFQPYESDELTAGDITRFLNVLAKIVEAIAKVAEAASKKKAAKTAEKAGAGAGEAQLKKVKSVKETLEKLPDKKAIQKAVEGLGEAGAFGFLSFLNGNDAFTTVTISGSVTSNGPQLAPDWSYQVTGGTLSANQKRKVMVKAKTGARNIKRLQVHELNAKGIGLAPGKDPEIGAYLLDLAVVVREKPKTT